MNIVDCAVAIVYAEGHVLLGKRASDRLWFPNIWDLIGCHLESGESPERALVRELWEEIGVTATSYRLVSISAGAAGTRYHVYFISEWTGEPFNKAKEEHTEVRWFPAAEIPRPWKRPRSERATAHWYSKHWRKPGA